MTAKELRALAARNRWDLRWLPIFPGTKALQDGGLWDLTDGHGLTLAESYGYPDTPKGRGDAMKDLCRRVGKIRKGLANA